MSEPSDGDLNYAREWLFGEFGESRVGCSTCEDLASLLARVRAEGAEAAAAEMRRADAAALAAMADAIEQETRAERAEKERDEARARVAGLRAALEDAVGWLQDTSAFYGCGHSSAFFERVATLLEDD